MFFFGWGALKGTSFYFPLPAMLASLSLRGKEYPPLVFFIDFFLGVRRVIASYIVLFTSSFFRQTIGVLCRHKKTLNPSTLMVD